MRYILTVLFILTFFVSIGQVYNPTPQYVFKNKLGVGRSTPVDSAAYMNVGPNGGAVAGIVLPRVADTLTISGTKRHGLLIFSNQLDKFAWYDSTNARWQEVGSGSGSDGEVMLMNGSATVGDSLLFSTITGDTAYIRNILAGSGLLFENMGDTVLKLNVDSSTVANIYNSDGTISGSRTVTMDNDISFTTTQGKRFSVYTEDTYGGNSLYGSYEINPFETSSIVDFNGFISGMFADTDGSQKPTLFVYAAKGLYIQDRTGLVQNADSIMPVTTPKDTAMYWNPSTGQVMRARTKNPIYSLNTSGTGANLTISATDYRQILPDLTAAAASRTVTMPTGETGKEIIIVNKNSDATYKWTFASTVVDISGATITAIDDLKAYTLLYDGTNWVIINVY